LLTNHPLTQSRPASTCVGAGFRILSPHERLRFLHTMRHDLQGRSAHR
jgi:hypothetical protein